VKLWTLTFRKNEEGNTVGCSVGCGWIYLIVAFLIAAIIYWS
jgi:hypothetical protein